MRWLILVLFLSGCGLSTLGLLGGSDGPTVNSNAQIGKENRQSVMSVEQTEEVSAGRDVIQTEIIKEVETGAVGSLDIINTNIPPWVMLLLILGWLLPTPTEIGRGIMNFILTLFGRKDNPKYERYK
tara:strand:+ start:550 stop:930 length:381 start_codon:yes stop_codon:yes gene_type:complete